MKVPLWPCPSPKETTQTYILRMGSWHLSEEISLKTEMEIQKGNKWKYKNWYNEGMGQGNKNIRLQKAKVITEDTNKLKVENLVKD